MIELRYILETAVSTVAERPSFITAEPKKKKLIPWYTSGFK